MAVRERCEDGCFLYNSAPVVEDVWGTFRQEVSPEPCQCEEVSCALLRDGVIHFPSGTRGKQRMSRDFQDCNEVSS